MALDNKLLGQFQLVNIYKIMLKIWEFKKI
jgi:hypothetical protein